MAKIEIVTKGRYGAIRYIEGSLFKKNACEFYWEFSGGNVVASVWFPAGDNAWDAKYPWAKGRRMEIVRDMAEQVRRKQAPSARIEWEADRLHLVGG
jgi:hypothetical protein